MTTPTEDKDLKGEKETATVAPEATVEASPLETKVAPEVAAARLIAKTQRKLEQLLQEVAELKAIAEEVCKKSVPSVHAFLKSYY